MGKMLRAGSSNSGYAHTIDGGELVQTLRRDMSECKDTYLSIASTVRLKVEEERTYSIYGTTAIVITSTVDVQDHGASYASGWHLYSTG